MRARVRDEKGREWIVKQRFTPWRPALFNRLRGRSYALVLPPRRTATGDQELNRVEQFVGGVLSGELLAVAIYVLVLSPFLLLELGAQALAGSVLWLLRTIGLARRRVEVIGHSDHMIHSVTVLLVRGGRGTVRRLIADLAAERDNAAKSFRPEHLPPHVTVREHRSIWQPSGMWRGPVEVA